MNSLIHFAHLGYIDLFYTLLRAFREDRLHFLLTLLYGRHLFRTFHFISKGFFASLRVQMYFESSVSFLLFV